MIKEVYQMYIIQIYFKLISNGLQNKFNYKLMKI